MAKNSIFRALERADTLFISSKILSDEVSLQQKDFLAKHIGNMSANGMRFFIASNFFVLFVALFRMSYLLLFNYVGFDFNFFDEPSAKLHYLYVITLASIIFMLFMLFSVLKPGHKKDNLYLCKSFQRRFISYTYAVTLVWMFVLSFYHHQVIYDPAFRSILPALIVIIPITYVGAMLVIPSFSIMMLLCLMVNHVLDSQWVSLFINLLVVVFLTVFIGSVFFAVRRTIGFIAKIEFNNFKLTEKLIRSLNLDPLLLIPNRQAFFSSISNKLARKTDDDIGAAILMLDVDHFKLYNDHYGHPAGDRCLQQVVACVQESLREDIDMFGRYGGEEFILFLDQVDEAGAQLVAERILSNIEQLALPHIGSATARYVTISIGIAPWQPGSSLESLCELADQALYQAKRNGRNRYVLYDAAATPTG